MASLPLEDRFAGAADDIYEWLIQAHDGLTDDDSAALNARLVLILANALGDPPMVRQAIELAGRGLRPVLQKQDTPK